MTITTAGGLAVAAPLHAFIVDEALPGTGVDADTFFRALADVVATFGPRNGELLARRAELQERLDAWHAASPGPVDREVYTGFLATSAISRRPPMRSMSISTASTRRSARSPVPSSSCRSTTPATR